MKSLLRKVKNALFKPGVQPLAIRSGPFAGVKLNLDLAGQTQNYLGLSERELHKWLVRFLPGLKTVIDVGSEAGIYTIFAMLRTGAERVFAFEPSDAVREKMVGNFALNGLKIEDPRLYWSQCFVGNRNEAEFVTLSKIAGAAPGPMMVKIDIDGGEFEALQGAGELLSRKDVRWIVETHSVKLESDCLKILRSAGLVVKVIKNAWWRVFVPEQRPIPLNRWLVAYHPSDAV